MSTNTFTEEKQKENSEFKKLLQERFVGLPKVGDIIKGTILTLGSKEIKIEVNGVAVGVVRGYELPDPKTASELKVGDVVEALVVDLENENGEMELSLRIAGSTRAWDQLEELIRSKTTITILPTDANKGGLMAALHGITGFLPVSQLNPDHYPRVQGGDKSKIFERLKELIGKELKVKVLDVNEREQKLIFSEKALWEEDQKGIISQYKVGDIVEGEITALTAFGAFLRFGDNLEGLIHISELAWQRIDHPSDVVAAGLKVKAQIIQIDGAKIFLSMKRLVEDPWRTVSERYKVGDVVKGRVLKVNPFGLFVEIDPDIHGLAHVSELSNEPIEDVNTFCKAGDEFDFEVVSLEPAAHRLGLRIAGVKPKEHKTAHAKETHAEETQKETQNNETPADPPLS